MKKLFLTFLLFYFLTFLSNGIASEIEQPIKRKSAFKAVLLSTAVPGMGEYYASAKNRSYFFWGLETTGWLSFYAYTLNIRWKEEEYKNYAKVYAGANVEDRDNKFFYDMSDFIASEGINSYNEDRRAFARYLYLIGELGSWAEVQAYIRANTYSESEGWQWISKEHWDRYKEIREEHFTSRQRRKFFVGMLIINRLLSAIDAAQAVRSYNKVSDEHNDNISKGNFNINFQMNESNNIPMIIMKKSF